ncbi:MAG: D-Ala-D-Ala carboxypeptidase family metallohydrolase, partial [Minisyncoccia bacterium]
TSLVPGVRITSGARDPANNRRVGGATGSFHLQDRARDLVPPAGMTMAQLAAQYRQAGFRALDEGDHVHVSW